MTDERSKKLKGNRNAAKPAKEKKGPVVQVPATAWQAAGWTKAAQKLGVTRPQFVRDAADAAARKAGVKI